MLIKLGLVQEFRMLYVHYLSKPIFPVLQDGKTAEELARTCGHTEVADLIRVSTEYLNPFGLTPIDRYPTISSRIL